MVGCSPSIHSQCAAIKEIHVSSITRCHYKDTSAATVLPHNLIVAIGRKLVWLIQF